MTALTIAIPDLGNLDQKPCWPDWVGLRLKSIKNEYQRSSRTGRYQLVPTIPSSLALSHVQRKAIEEHVHECEKLLEQTPALSFSAKQAALGLIAELYLGAFHGTRVGEIDAEVGGKHYLIALNDVPTWAIKAAFDKWLRGSCGLNEHGADYNYDWRPSAAALRRVSMNEVSSLKRRIYQMRELLNAESLVEFDEKHCAEMRARIAALATVPRI